MKRIFVVLVAALALPAAAAAKGPSKAEVSGPGLHEAIVVRGAENPGTPLMNLAESSGFFPLVFGQSPDPTLPHRPDGKLGPRYSVVYRVPGPNGAVSTIRSDLYPYATPYAVSYMKPGQQFWGGQTRGGWFLADSRLKSTLVRSGLSPTPATGGGGGPTPWWIAGVVGGVALLAGAAWLIVRRRPHGTTAPEPT